MPYPDDDDIDQLLLGEGPLPTSQLLRTALGKVRPPGSAGTQLSGGTTPVSPSQYFQDRLARRADREAQEPSDTVTDIGPNLNELYERRMKLLDTPPDFSGVAQAARGQQEAADRDFKAGLALSALGGKRFAPAGQAILHNALAKSTPLRANLADAGYFDPTTGNFVVNPLIEQQRQEKVASSLLEQGIKHAEKQHAELVAQGRFEEARALDAQRLEFQRGHQELMEELARRRTEQGQGRLDESIEARRQREERLSKAKPLTLPEKKELIGAQSVVDTNQHMGETFRDDYGGQTKWGGNINNWIAANMAGTPAQREQAEWWGNYAREKDIFERHAMFGASLTAPEKASWDAATINPGMASSEIKRRLARQSELAQRALTRWTDALRSGEREEQIQALTTKTPAPHETPRPRGGAAAPGPGAPAGAPQHYRMDSRGNLIED